MSEHVDPRREAATTAGGATATVADSVASPADAAEELAVADAAKLARATSRPRTLNVPNAITLSRLVLAFIVFQLIYLDGWWITAAALFVAAAATDFLDGYIARRTGQVTVLGRILDPFVDKIIVCGAFLFLVAHPESGVCAWTAFVVFAREMFVTSLRSFLEMHRVDFSASWLGKLKMVMQCIAVPVCLVTLSPVVRETFGTGWPIVLRDICVYAMLTATILSGVVYATRAASLIRDLRLSPQD